MTQTNPEQWARNVYWNAALADRDHGSAYAAEIIQAAFAEQIEALRDENAEGWHKVGFLEVNLKQANEAIEAINRHLPKYQAALAEVKQLKAVFAKREAHLVEALEDVVDPLGYLKRHAEAKGSQLSGMAYQIANDPSFAKSIAKEALAALKDRTHG